MHLELPATAGRLWDSLDSKVRNQVRKGRKGDLRVQWGGAELIDDFYDVFARNMRDLGTPVYPATLFREAFRRFPGGCEICVVRAGHRAVAAAFTTHGRGYGEVPSASSLREFNASCANMLMYWSILERAVQRGHAVFDFGRSTPDGPVYRFKKQWGARPAPADWRVFVRSGEASQMRPDHPRYGTLIEAWKKLPVWATRLLGPSIVRGIP
jgi:FemAB-related protein (PEP-CTERM system-associated)